jgi:GNAT superfamily N-acetyltransferase
MPYEVTLPGGYTVSDDPTRLDIDLIHRFLSEESYWAKGRSRALVERSIAGSLCLGVYRPQGQVGFARIVTDRCFFAWVCDVFVLPEARGQSIATGMMAAALRHPDLTEVARWMLVTTDAQGLYGRLGFGPYQEVYKLMAYFPPKTS